MLEILATPVYRVYQERKVLQETSDLQGSKVELDLADSLVHKVLLASLVKQVLLEAGDRVASRV